jgi:paraquat-inducible protein B
MSEPEQGGTKPGRDFVSREVPPVLETAVPGTTFLLKANELGSVGLGSTMFYRGLDVGEFILGWDVADMAESVTIHAFVRSPFDGCVRDLTPFWNASRVSVEHAGGGVDMQVESLRAVLIRQPIRASSPKCGGSPTESVILSKWPAKE